MIETGLPPYDPIPDHVRDRIRHKVQTRIRKPRLRTPIAVAASVALLAAGTLVITTKSSTPFGPATPMFTDIAMDRCWAAIEKSGKTSLYPPRAAWRVTVAQTPVDTPLTVVGIATTEMPFFCQTTDMTVTVSSPAIKPEYLADHRTALLMMTGNGVLAGVIDPAWPAAHLFVPPRAESLQVAREGMFIYPTRVDATTKVLAVRAERNFVVPNDGPKPDVELPRPPVPEISMVDRPVPPPDRTSDRGRLLGACMADYHEINLQDPDSYNPGAQAELGGSRMTMAVSDTWIAFCAYDADLGSFGQAHTSFIVAARRSEIDPNEPTDVRTGWISSKDGSRPTLGGAVPERTARMELTFENGNKIRPDVAKGTFVVIVPREAPLDDRGNVRGAITAQLFDSSGTLFYSGPLRRHLPPK
jgi:hypothetical protein